MEIAGDFALRLISTILGVLLGDYIWSFWERKKKK